MQIRQLSPEDSSLFPNALELLNRLQGRDIFPANYLDERARDPLSFVVAAFSDTRLIGVAVAQVIDNFDYYEPFGKHIASDLKNRRVGSLATMSVHEAHQGQGVGQKLSQARLNWLRRQNCEAAVGMSWVSGLKHTSDRVFEKMGFKAVGRHETFYKQASVAREFICPACGPPPCQCPAILYVMELK